MQSLSDQRFKQLSHTVDLERLRIETDTILWQPAHNRYADQLSLQTDGSADWDSSTGTQVGQAEGQWDKLHPDLTGTWWEGFFAGLPFKVYRARLMTMHPRTCYSIHADNNPRIHIAIKTHRQARFIFTSPPTLRHIPADGHIWWVDTTKEHSAMNGSLEARIHLVACLVNTADN
jgi:hypothetical protein